MIARGLVWALGLSQLLCWGVTYYLIAVFGGPIADETGWSHTVIYGGFSAAIVVMALVSPTIGRLVQERGGRPVMATGSVLIAAGCIGLALSRNLVAYYAAWLVLGLAMRMTLYDAAFAALARIGGTAAQRPISQITLLGGLASTTLWPVGQALTGAFGWRCAVLCYAGIGLLTLPLHLAIPTGRHRANEPAGTTPIAPLARSVEEQRIARLLFAGGLMLATFLASAMSAHMIGLLAALGLPAASAVAVSTLRGIGQSAARLAELLFGRRLNPLSLGVLAATLAPISFVLALWGGASLAAALGFALLFGAGNGLSTIVRGTQPLVLFDPREYGALTGRLIGPSFYASAVAPALVAWLIDGYGPIVGIGLALAAAVGALACAIALWLSFRPNDPRRAG